MANGTPGFLERFGAQVGAGIIILLLSWTGLTMIDLRQSVAVQGQRIGAVERNLRELSANISTGMADRYTATEAAADLNRVWTSLARVQDQLQRMK